VSMKTRNLKLKEQIETKPKTEEGFEKQQQ
jgi:hypothetical protein